MELNKIYLGNAYELIKQLKDHSVDLIVTDPPRYIGPDVPNSELDEKQELPPMTPEQFDEMCQETENENAKGS